MLNNQDYGDVDYFKLADVMSRLPFRTDIRFIGAEPTMNKHLPALIRLARQGGHRPSLLTNGLNLRREKYAKSLKDAGLNMLGLSMNGGVCDDQYKRYDGAPLAKQKMMALENCFKYNIVPHVNVIVDPGNIHVLPDLIDYMVKLGIKYNRKFSPYRFPAALRLKSVGQMGFHMNTSSFTLKELAEIASNLHAKSVDDILINHNIDGYEEARSALYTFDTSNGVMIGKLTDWNVDEEGICDPGSTRRGILTGDYKIAPFFEYYKGKEQEDVLT
jgi:molybdenum cofactor biosynthesis enzyme MoaA